MRALLDTLDKHQLALYLAAIAAGCAIGAALPTIAKPAALGITPLLGLLLTVTFLGVPFRRLIEGLRDGRFLASLLIVNFAVVPVVVFALSRFVAGDEAILLGVLFVLLTPCVDYVIVFAGLAGGSQDRLLGAAPLLMLGQLVLLPGYLWLFVDGAVITSIDPAPFVEAFLLLIVLPLAAAWCIQQLAVRSQTWRHVERGASASMVPLMMLTLLTVVASQVAAVGGQFGRLSQVVPIFIAFAIIMLPVGLLVARILRVDTAGSRAVVFSGVTRNSLVVLPLVLALPPVFDLAPLVVVTQTLIELVAMLALVKLVPMLVRS